MVNENRPSNNSANGTLITVVIVVAALYLARVVLIPIALSILLSFLLAPLVIRLRHLGLGKIPSTLIVVAFTFSAIAAVGLFFESQAVDLAKKLPEYQENVQTKMQSIRTSGGGMINRVSRVVHNVSEALNPSPPPPSRNAPTEEKPVPVEIRKAPFAPMEMIQKVLGSVLNILVTTAIVIVFVIFMLVQREDLRDRIIRLGGAGRVNVTTQALDDAAHRLGQYLLVQLVINVGFGLLAGVGLYFMHVPNPVLWALLAALLRYVPYLGIWIAAALPAMMAFAVEPGWVKVPAVFGLYFGIDLLMYNFVEPLLYGSSTGISPVAILVAAVFWTWLWGPVGLLLATPLTVCVAVLGRYVPRLEFLSVLLSDEQVLRPETRFYQRMLAMDLEEATDIAEGFLKGKSLEELDDAVILPALGLVEEERHRGRLDESREQFIFQNTRMLLEDLAERADEVIQGNGSGKSKARNGEAAAEAVPENANEQLPPVLCIPARDEADDIAALMLVQLLQKRGIPAQRLSSAALAGECVEAVGRGQARIACVTSVPPFGYTHARYLCRRLRSQFPELKIIAAFLTEGELDEIKQRQPPIPADEVVVTLKQALAGVLSHLPSANAPASAPVLNAA